MELEEQRTLADEFRCMAPLLPERMSATSREGRITVTLNQPRGAEA